MTLRNTHREVNRKGKETSKELLWTAGAVSLGSSGVGGPTDPLYLGSRGLLR